MFRTAAVTLLTDASGNCTATSEPVTGRVLAVIYHPGTLATGADLTVTGETNGQQIITITNGGTSNILRYPRVPVHDETGTAATTDGTRALRDYPIVVNERISIAVVQGGNAGTGTISFIIG